MSITATLSGQENYWDDQQDDFIDAYFYGEYHVPRYLCRPSLPSPRNRRELSIHIHISYYPTPYLRDWHDHGI